MTAVGIALLVVSCVCAYRYPPVGMAIFVMCALGGDSTGAAGFFETVGLGLFSYFGRMIAIVAVTKSFLVLWRRRTDTAESRRLFLYAFVVAVVSAVIGVGALAKGTTVPRIPVEIF